MVSRRPDHPLALAYARAYPNDDPEALAKMVQRKFPALNGEYLVNAARGYRLEWIAQRKGDVPRWVAPLPVRKRVKV